MQVHFDKWTCTSPGSSAPVEIENIECSRACRGYCGLREVEWSVSQSCGDVCVLGCALDPTRMEAILMNRNPNVPRLVL